MIHYGNMSVAKQLRIMIKEILLTSYVIVVVDNGRHIKGIISYTSFIHKDTKSEKGAIQLKNLS